MRRRVLVIPAVMLAVVVLALATSPFWVGAVARPICGRFGLSFGRYERIGYRRFALHEVEFRRGQTRVTLARAEADTPVLWLWHRWTSQRNMITGTTWRVDVARASETAAAPGEAASRSGATAVPASPASPAPAASRVLGWVSLRVILQRVADRLEQWLPEARVGAGVVQWSTGELSLVGADWGKRELAVQGFVYRALHLSGRAAFPRGEDIIRANVHGDDTDYVSVVESRGDHASGYVTWAGQRLDVDGQFASSGWLPAEAALRADAIDIPGERLRVGQLYSAVRGHARLDWKSNQFTTDVAVQGVPIAGKQQVPPLGLDAHAQGDPESITIQSLLADLPGIKARLSEPVTIARNGVVRGERARIVFEADLAQQPWLPATGRVNGEARLVSDLAQAPEVEYQLQAQNVSAKDLAVTSVEANGRFHWPAIELTTATIVGGEGERLTLRGRWDFAGKILENGVVQGEIRRRSLAGWLPALPEFDSLTLQGEISGPVADIHHHVTARAEGFKVRAIKPFATAVEWQGHGATIDSFNGTATAGATTVKAVGAVSRAELVLDQFELAQGDQVRLKLTEKATLRWQPSLEFESVHLSGPEGSFDGNGSWSDTGRIEISARNLDPAWFQDFVSAGPAKWQLTLLAITGSWDRGPLTFSISGGGQVDIGNGHVVSVMTSARGNKDGIAVEALRATEGEATVLNALGRVPVVIFPRDKSLVHIEPNGEIAVDATAAPHATFWDQLAAATGVELKEPQASARLKGTWLRPEGEVRLSAARVAVDAERFKRPLPELSELQVLLSGTREGVRLDTFALRVEGQEIRAQGRLPIPDGNWSEVIKQPLEIARRGADLKLSIPGADLSAFTRFLPGFVAPKGQLQVDLAYREAGFDGAVRLRDAASRPLGPLGVLQEINADVQMTGRTFELRNVSALSGGQPVNLTGKVEIPSGNSPRYDLSLKGTNLPFVRQAGLVLRGDVDLKLQSPANSPPRLSGGVKLRDSLFLADIRSFLPQGGATAARRPPYFAVEVSPLNAWALAVDVQGDHFLRVRTPVFNGVASARFHLGGSLGEPRAIGAITVDEGTVLMPFASFDIQQAAVRLTEANPFEPTLYARGTGRRFGYDLTMELEGAATSPNVSLSSSPALATDQVLQMVMTGAPPTDDIQVTARQRATTIGTFLGQSLLGSLGTDVANPDRLSIASGEKISRQGKETYEIEYKLSGRWTVTTEYTEYDEYNSGVKYRLFPRKDRQEMIKEEKADANK